MESGGERGVVFLEEVFRVDGSALVVDDGVGGGFFGILAVLVEESADVVDSEEA